MDRILGQAKQGDCTITTKWNGYQYITLAEYTNTANLKILGEYGFSARAALEGHLMWTGTMADNKDDQYKIYKISLSALMQLILKIENHKNLKIIPYSDNSGTICIQGKDCASGGFCVYSLPKQEILSISSLWKYFLQKQRDHSLTRQMTRSLTNVPTERPSKSECDSAQLVGSHL